MSNTNIEKECLTELCSILFDADSKLRVSMEKLKTLVEAETEGRVLILPCKECAEVYRIAYIRDSYDDSLHPIVTRDMFRLNMLDKIGKTVFLNKDDAELALSKL